MKEYRMSQPKLFEKLIQVFGSISAISGKKILVIRDLEVALMLSVRNAVVYITDDKDCAEVFRKNTEAGMGEDDKVFFINNYKTELKELLNDMHFDVAIQNPPYDRNLHLKILAEVLKHADKVINISPVRWLQDPFAAYSNKSDYKKFEESVSKKIETLDVISAKNASELFGASFTMNLGIYTCGQGGYDYQHNDPLITKIVEKTMEHSWAGFSQKKFYDSGCVQTKPYALNVTAYGAENMVVNTTYESQIATALMCEKSVRTGGDGSASSHFEFDTEEERRNFYDCYCHPFMQWHTKQWKSDVHVKSYKVPYFDYYDHAWDYEDFFAWFGLTAEERVRVMSEIAQMQAEKAA